MRYQPPCKGCGMRNLGCHADCELFLEFQENHEAEKETIRKNKQNNARQHFMSDREFNNRNRGHNKNKVFKQTMR